MRKWKMPAWMEKYRICIVNTGGNPVEELMNDDGINSNLQNNAVRALLCVAVKSQISLLEQLHNLKLLS